MELISPWFNFIADDNVKYASKQFFFIECWHRLKTLKNRINFFFYRMLASFENFKEQSFIF